MQASNTQADMVISSLISRPRAVLPPQCRALCSRRGQGVPSKLVCRNYNRAGRRIVRPQRVMLRDEQGVVERSVGIVRHGGMGTLVQGRTQSSYEPGYASAVPDLGNEPPLSVDGEVGELDHRRISVQWFSATILTGLCGAALMGGAVFAALDGEANFAASPEIYEASLRGTLGQAERGGVPQGRSASRAERDRRRPQDDPDIDDQPRGRSRGGPRAALCACLRQSVALGDRDLGQPSSVQSAEAPGRPGGERGDKPRGAESGARRRRLICHPRSWKRASARENRVDDPAGRSRGARARSGELDRRKLGAVRVRGFPRHDPAGLRQPRATSTPIRGSKRASSPRT